jgi:DEAD/DEAH box helicase domain-containing protein
MEFNFLNNWTLVYEHIIPEKKAEYIGFEDLNLSSKSRQYLKEACPKGLYLHQREAIKRYLEGNNICITTGTASGKSLPFYVLGIEELVKDPRNRIIAIYPLRALGREQESRWERAISCAGLDIKIGRIDGQVPSNMRKGIIKGSNIIIMTPDIIHAWLLSNLNDPIILELMRNISLIIVDEVHSYTGVFGSNSAFLFRRLRHILNLLDRDPRFICASATIADPNSHLYKLLGLNVEIIGPNYDTSPRYEMNVQLLTPPRNADLLTEISNLIYSITTETDKRFIAFVDSRKQTEHISSILARYQDKDEELKELDNNIEQIFKLNVLPYRAGYEEEDRNAIQDRLNSGMLSGVISTSALELGIDIPFLNMGILIGVPQSSTSLYQRIGRIGRNSKGNILVINTGDVYDEAIFKNPEEVLKRPLAEGALYLENSRIQYIHALCLARHGGENDQICEKIHKNDELEFNSQITWPDGFIELCRMERLGEVPIDLQNMKTEAGDDPNHTFPLRDVESQFKVEYKDGPYIKSLGSLSYSQLMREAYPGAVYYYITSPYRVVRVNFHHKTVQVRHEKRYTTQPIELPKQIFPNMSEGNIYRANKYGDMIIIECNLQVRESLCGFKERRGPNELSFNYPLRGNEINVYFDMSRFTRNYFTTGMVITHPSLNLKNVDCEIIAELLYEAFLMVIPFERRDLSFASDSHRKKRGDIESGARFISIFDQTYGSLRLSGRFMETSILKMAVEKSLEIAIDNNKFEVNQETLDAIKKLYEESLKAPEEYKFEIEFQTMEYEKLEKVILPKSRGLNISRNNEEFEIEDVYFNPKIGSLCYRGKHLSSKNQDVIEIVPLREIIEIPGESRLGYYNYETGEIKSLV